MDPTSASYASASSTKSSQFGEPSTAISAITSANKSSTQTPGSCPSGPSTRAHIRSSGSPVRGSSGPCGRQWQAVITTRSPPWLLITNPRPPSPTCRTDDLAVAGLNISFLPKRCGQCGGLFLEPGLDFFHAVLPRRKGVQLATEGGLL